MDIKFRAWHRFNEEMLPNESQSYEGQVFQWLREGQDIEVMQFAGLKDKNGVEIYFGDLIKNQRGRIAKVVWNKFTASFDSEFIGDDGSANDYEDKSYGFHNADWKYEVEVIGNIYQNNGMIY